MLDDGRLVSVRVGVGFVVVRSCGSCGDCSVPVSRLPQLVYETKKDLKANGLVSTIVGHAGDGNFHALVLFQRDDELPKVREAVHRMVERAIALDGTCESPLYSRHA